MRNPLAAMSCQGFDDNVEVATEFRVLHAVRARADLRVISGGMADHTAFPISLSNELAKLSILRSRDRNASNRPVPAGCGSDPS